LRLLLDTHALLWWLTDNPKLPVLTGRWIDDQANEIAVSPVSTYELRFKALKGLLPGGDMLAMEIRPCHQLTASG
jgi:PIN domain nuclease of toxin-antitoxin system